jgi:hypothetical protein
MKIRDACVWCSKIVTRPKDFDPAKHFLVCSDSCKKQEATFRIMFSDKHIGEKNMRDFGINPNHRGRVK